MDETVNIKVQEDGSRVVESNLLGVANASDKAGDSISALMKVMSSIDSTTTKISNSLDRLVNIQGRQVSSTSRVVQAQQAQAQTAVAVAKAVEEQAESEKDATARIQAMVQASLEQASASAAATTAAQQAASAAQAQGNAAQGAADANNAAAAAYTAAAGAANKQAMEMEALQAAVGGGVKTIDQWREVEGQLVDAQQRGVITMQQYNRMIKQLDSQLPGLTSSINKEQSAINSLTNRYDPLHAKMQQLERDEKALKDARDKGIISMTQYERIMAGIAGQRALVEKGAEEGSKALDGFKFASAGAAREYGVLVGELARGNWTRLEGSLLTLTNRVGLMQKLFTGLGLSILGLVGIIALLAVGLYKGLQQSDALNKSLIRLGGTSGETAASIQFYSQQLADGNRNATQTEELLSSLVATGRTTSATFGTIGRAAQNMLELTGQSVQEVTSSFENLYKDPVQWADEMDTKFHFLTLEVRDHAQSLIDVGDKYGAAEVVAKAFAENTKDRIDELNKSMGLLDRFITNFKQNNGFTRLWNTINDSGKTKDAIQDFMDLKKEYQDWLDKTKGSDSDYIRTVDAQFQARLKLLQPAAKELDLNTKIKEAQDQNRIALLDSAKIIDGVNDKTQKQLTLQNKLKQLHDSYQTQKNLGADLSAPRFAGVSFDAQGNPSGGAYASKVQELMQEANGKPKAPKKGRVGSDEQIRLWVEYNKQLTQLKETIDPTIAAMDKLTKAQDLLSEAVKRGDLQQNDADFMFSQYQAQLSDAINPLQAFTAKLDDQIRALKETGKANDALNRTEQAKADLLKAGQVLSDSQAASIQRQYEEIDKLTAKQQIYQRIQKGIIDDTKTYVDTITVLNEMMSKGTISQQQADKYLVNSNPDIFAGTQKQLEVQMAQYEEYYKEIDALSQNNFISERDRQVAMSNIRRQQQATQLGQAQTFLTALASMQGSSSAKANKVAKAAAISNALINTYTAATGAYASLASIPYVGPFLGAAAAAAAVVAGMAQVNAIRSTGNFRTGGEFMVGGSGGTDSQRVAFNATPGEKVTINTPAQARAIEKSGEQSNSGGSGDVSITNVTDVKSMVPVISSAAGRKEVLNVIRLEANTINGLLGRGA